MTKKLIEEMERKEATQYLKNLIKPNQIIYTILTKVSTSGTYRHIKVMIVNDGKIKNISWSIAKAGIGTYKDNTGSIGVSGGGMDMGYHIIHSLSSMLWPDGFDCLGQGKCPSNDHVNGDRDYTPHNHKDGGYMLGHEWL